MLSVAASFTDVREESLVDAVLRIAGSNPVEVTGLRHVVEEEFPCTKLQESQAWIELDSVLLGNGRFNGHYNLLEHERYRLLSRLRHLCYLAVVHLDQATIGEWPVAQELIVRHRR